jgi:uncharacterized membrane protein
MTRLTAPDPARPRAAALRLHRDLRVGLVQLVYLAIGLLLGLLLPSIHAGPTVESAGVSPLALGIAGGFISFIALVFSLLFLVVQYGNTTVSPRLTLFRDDPIVWHSFGFFGSVFVYTATVGTRLGGRNGDVSLAVPVLAILSVLAAMALARSLQLRALRLLQFNATMEEIQRRGTLIIASLFTEPVEAAPLPAYDLPPVATPVLWTEQTALLRQIDLPRLLAQAISLDAVIELRVHPGGEVRRGLPFATVNATRAVDGVEIAEALATGSDRTFAQDPLLAFRLLSDIGDRALSPAVNDPATAVQALGCVYDLLALVVDKALEVGKFTDGAGRLRVLVPFPTWDGFLSAGVDEIAHYGRGSPLVCNRVRALLSDLCAIAPPERRDPIEQRLAECAVDARGRA